MIKGSYLVLIPIVGLKKPQSNVSNTEFLQAFFSVKLCATLWFNKKTPLLGARLQPVFSGY